MVNVGRQIDKPVERLVADIEIQWRNDMVLSLQPLLKLCEMRLLEQHGLPVIDGFAIIEEVEFSRVDGKSSRAQRRQAVLEKTQTVGNRSEMLERAGQPIEIVAPERVGNEPLFLEALVPADLRFARFCAGPACEAHSRG